MSNYNEILEEPDEWRAIPEEQPKLFHAKVVFEDGEIGQFEFGNIPVKSGDRTIGCVTGLTNDISGHTLELTIDYATPERFEIENGTLFAMFEHNTVFLTKKKRETPKVVPV